MTALLISVTPVKGTIVLLAVLAVGVLLTQWVQLMIADRRDVADQQREADEDQAMQLGNSGAVRRIPEQRVSPEDGAR